MHFVFSTCSFDNPIASSRLLYTTHMSPQYFLISTLHHPYIYNLPIILYCFLSLADSLWFVTLLHYILTNEKDVAFP